MRTTRRLGLAGLCLAVALPFVAGCALPQQQEQSYHSFLGWRVSTKPNYTVRINYTQGGQVIEENTWPFKTVEKEKDGSYENTGLSLKGLTLSDPEKKLIKIGDMDVPIYNQRPEVKSIPFVQMNNILNKIINNAKKPLDEVTKALE